MKFCGTSLVAMASLSVMVACSPQSAKEKNGVIRLNSAAILADESLSTTEKAEELALAGEQLAGPVSFMYADVILDQSLKIDPQNKRAQFLKAFLATPMALKGILARVKPILDLKAEDKAEYERIVKAMPNSALKTFLLKGSPDIKSERDLQGLFTEIHLAQEKFRLFLKSNKDLEITLHMPEWAYYTEIGQEAMDQCGASEVSEGEYLLKVCDMSRVLEVDINRADIESLQQITAAIQIMMVPYISYDLTGTLAVKKKFEGKEASNKVILKELAKYPEFGKLINAQALQNIIGMGIDAIAGVRWASQLQKELCPNGTSHEKNRKGFLVNQGLCMDSVYTDGKPLEETLKMIELVLSGQTQSVNLGRDDLQTDVNYVALLQNPISDLKALHPVWNACGKLHSVSDDTIGGLLPNHDANEILSITSQCDMAN